MPLDDLMDKLARGRTLNAIEISKLRDEMRALEDVKILAKGWATAGSANPSFFSMSARTGKFDVTPLDFIRIQRTSAQSIPDNTETVLQIVADKSDTFVAVGSAIQCHVSSSRIICVVGTIQWAAAAGGRRAAHINLYDASDALLYGSTLHSRLPTNILADTIPFAATFFVKDVEGAESIKLTCLQSSGGALNMNYFSAGLFLVR